MSYRNAHSSGGDASFTTNDVNANQDSFFQKIESYRIPFKLPFELSFTSQRQIRCPLSSRQGGLDDEVDSTGLLAINNSFFSIVQRDIFALEEHLVVAAIKVNGPWDIVIKNVEFISADSKVRQIE